MAVTSAEDVSVRCSRATRAGDWRVIFAYGSARRRGWACAAAGTAGAIVWMAGNLGGLIVALVVQLLIHHPMGAFLALGGVSLLGLPVAARLPPTAAADDAGGQAASAAAG
jgi:hypothetical protein